MYSPTIAEHLIPRIYRLARARGQHMTTLVNEALASYLADQDVPAAGNTHPREVSGPASDLEYGFARLHIHRTQQLVAAEQVVLTSEIVKVPLQAVHAIHFFESIRHLKSLATEHTEEKKRQIVKSWSGTWPPLKKLCVLCG